MNGYNMEKDMLSHNVLHDARNNVHAIDVNGSETHSTVPLINTQFPELGNITGGLISDRIIELERRIVLYEAMFHGLSGKLDQHFKRYDMTIKAQQQQINDLNVLISKLLNQHVKNAELTRDRLFHYIPHLPAQPMTNTVSNFSTNNNISFNSASDDDDTRYNQMAPRQKKNNLKKHFDDNSNNGSTIIANNNSRIFPTTNSDTLFEDILDDGLNSKDERKLIDKPTFIRERFDSFVKPSENNVNNIHTSTVSAKNNSNTGSTNNNSVSSAIPTSTCNSNNNSNNNSHIHRRSISTNINDSNSSSKYSMFQMETKQINENNIVHNNNNNTNNVNSISANNNNNSATLANNKITKPTNNKSNKSRLNNIHLPSSSNTPNTDKIIEFKFMKSPHSVKDIWLEYVEGTEGQPSIRQMEFMYQATWRRDPAMNKRYSRRKVLWKAIETGLQKGYNIDEIIKILEDYRSIDKRNGIKQPIGWLCQTCNIPEMFR